MQSAVALLALLALAALLYVPLQVSAEDYHTYVSNQSNMDIKATITYSFRGNPGFTNRTIASKKYDSDVYSKDGCLSAKSFTPVNVEIWLGNNPNSCEVQAPCDASIVLISTASFSVDIYPSAYGLINNPQGDSLVTLYF